MVGSTDDNGNQVWTGNGFTVTVNSTKRVSGGASIYLKPGYEYAVYNVTVEDQSAPKVQVFVAAGAAKDSDGYKYSGDIVPNDPQILHPDDLAPGQKVRGNVAFAVPIGADVSIVAVPAQLPVATAC
jgi:hypothetical protein